MYIDNGFFYWALTDKNDILNWKNEKLLEFIFIYLIFICISQHIRSPGTLWITSQNLLWKQSYSFLREWFAWDWHWNVSFPNSPSKHFR